MTPERRLMIHVVVRAVEDAKSLIHRTYIYGREAKFNPWAKRDLETLKNEMRHPWFGLICSYADVHRDNVLNKIEQLEERAKLKHARAG